MRAMTAYAYVREAKEGERVEIIAKSLNSKHLDIIIYHLPPKKIPLEKRIKKLIERRIYRGRVEFYILVNSSLTQRTHINRDLLQAYLREINRISSHLRVKKELDVLDLLNLPGLINVEERKKISNSLILRAAKKAVEKITYFREREGEAIKKKILTYIKKLREVIEKIKRAKPKGKAEELGREDIDEEVALIFFYVKKLERIVKTRSSSPQGKLVDFLAQEILKELNTCASKTKKVRVASLILEAKSYSERIREQAQNIE
jgi:uncharacterized protein YicC (UPF0701 family)